ncbi:ABC transporter substrate-binding protein, partial [Oleiphilus sp. HI0079]|uniref:ABC transporter substrate-binding protein n=1 Tax=Oleiphilus sp. HI0079 TaxID=1822254 RepID=UPI000A786C5A
SLAYAQTNAPRIISADLGTTQILRALGLAEHVVAIDLTSSREEAFHHLPNIGYHRQLSPEGLLSLNADVLIGSSLMWPERTLDVLRATHVKVIQQETPENLSMLTNNIFQI